MQRQVLARLLVVFALSCSSCDTPGPLSTDLLTAEERAYLQQRGGIRLAPDPNFSPVESFDAQGRYVGLIADYFDIIVARADIDIEFVHLDSWDDVIRQAYDRKVDGITAAQITKDRQKYLTFSQPIVDIPNVIIARRGADRVTMDDLDEKAASVALTRGNAIHEFVEERFPRIRLELVHDDLLALQAVAFGKADATVVNLAIASHLVHMHGLGGLEVVGDSGRSNPLAIATRKDEPVLARILAKGLASVTPQERESIYRKWVGLESGPFGLNRDVLFTVGTVIAVLMGAFGLAFIWVVTLRKRVAERTRQLEREFTERKRAEEEKHAMERRLLEAQKLESLGVLAGGVAHDFNNLLMSIVGNADLALLDAPVGHIRERLEDILEGAGRASDLARQMLAYSGRGRVVVELVDLTVIVREMVRLLSASVSKSARIVLELPDVLPFVEADASQMRQLVMNLVINAAEALPDSGGEIVLGARLASLSRAELNTDANRAYDVSAPLEGGDFVVLTVRDDGSGMSAETKNKIFDPFFTTKFQGRGLGMSAVLGIVRGHRGALYLESELGRGTTFTVAFPVASGKRSEDTLSSYSFHDPTV